jgi:hypothetical protein
VFNEILRIKPVLDDASAKQMEQSLSSRFARVAGRFGQGLKSVIKGSFLGISLGLISRLLNPIEALEDKIKKLLGEGTDVRDLADRLGSSPGQVRQLQDVAQSLGVAPDQFKDLIVKYAEAIEKGREELANPFTEKSGSTLAVRNFVGEKDLAKSFQDFLTSLRASGQGTGSDLPLSDRAKRIYTDAAMKGQQVDQSVRQDLLNKGEIRLRTGLETRQAFEKEVFGQALTGPGRRLVDANLEDQAKKIGEPTTETLTEKINKAAGLADQKRALDVQNQTADFINATNKLNGQMIQQIATADKIQLDRDTKQLDSFADLKKASIAIEDIKGFMIQANGLISRGIGSLADMATFVGGLKQSRIFRGIFGKGD